MPACAALGAGRFELPIALRSDRLGPASEQIRGRRVPNGAVQTMMIVVRDKLLH